MSNEFEASHLERRIVQLEKHVAEQDVEIFRQAKLIDTLQKAFKRMELRLESSHDNSGSAGSGDLSHEKPPHY